MMNRMRLARVWPLLGLLAWSWAAERAAAQPLAIEVWHGTSQRVGHLGIAQADFNLLGHVNLPHRLVSPGGRTYRLNGQPPVALSYLLYRRLVADGDFNADIPIALLQAGTNTVVLEAVSTNGEHAVQAVTITRETGASALPVEIHWSQVTNAQEVGQYVDGKWGLTPGGLRTLDRGYDRLFLIGETTWQDYEVTVPVTIHFLDTTISPLSAGNGVGVILRFTGHAVGGCRNWPDAQPKWGYQPFGAIGWLWRTYTGRTNDPPNVEYYRGDSDIHLNFGAFPVTAGGMYWMKFRCETQPDAPDGSGVTRYSYKIWQHGQAEPVNWNWQQVQTSQCALRKGGVALVANNVDATFGDVVVHRLSVQRREEKGVR